MCDNHLLGVRTEKAYPGQRLLASDQSFIDGIRADRGGDVTTVAAHIDQGLLDAHLAKGEVDINTGLRTFADDRSLTGQGGGAAQPINLATIAVWTAKGGQHGPFACCGG